jgi:hypothetical protein
LGVGLTLRVMTPVITEADHVEALAGLAIETASWSGDGQWRRGLAIRAEVQKYQPDLLLLDGVKLPPGALLGLGARVAGFGSPHTAIRTSWAHGFVETHPGIGVDLVSPNLTAVPPVWDPHWYPPTEDLSQFGIPGGAFTVGSVATHADYLRWLVEAGHWLPLDLPIHFLVVVPAAERQQLRRQVLGTLLPQRYHVCETVEQAPALLASCNLSVLNYDEPIQRASTLNGIHYGVPLITLLSGNTEPYVIQVQGAEQLAAQVLEVYEDRDRHAALADACRQFGEQTSAAAEVLAQAVAALSE